MSDTVAYQVAAVIAARTDDPAYYQVLRENDNLRAKIDELAQALIVANDDKAILYRACSYAIGEITSGRVGQVTVQVLENILKGVTR